MVAGRRVTLNTASNNSLNQTRYQATFHLKVNSSPVNSGVGVSEPMKNMLKEEEKDQIRLEDVLCHASRNQLEQKEVINQNGCGLLATWRPCRRGGYRSVEEKRLVSDKIKMCVACKVRKKMGIIPKPPRGPSAKSADANVLHKGTCR